MTDAATPDTARDGSAPATAAPALTVEKARAADAESIHAVITYFADRGDMLHRPLNEVYENLRDFYVARVDGEFAGCAALHRLRSTIQP